MLPLWLLLLLLPLLTDQDTFFEGDLLFQDSVLAQQSPELFVKGSGFKWPGGAVPYAFEALSKFSPAEREVVRLAMEDIQDRTGCVEFVETDISRGGDIVLITKLGFGTQSGKGKCWAQLGRQGGTQAVNLGEPECITTQTVTHELLHTLGVIHEHTRFDRDDHVQIVSANVMPEKMHNFDIRAWKETDHSDTAYDYKSVMHYNMFAFSKTPDDLSKVTIQPHHKEFEGIGYYSQMSGIDAIEVALAYGCALKPETVVEFVNDNVEILQTVQNKHTEQIEKLMDMCGPKVSAVSSCNAPWTELATGCYLFRMTPSNWQEAKDVCQNKKSKLVEIDSREENTAIVNEVIKQRFRAQKQNFWLGLTDQEVEGDWRWTNGGERPSFTDWYPGEPNNAGSEGQNCAVLNTKDGKNKWYDIPCHREKIAWETFHALCEKLPSTSGPPPPGCDCRPGGITKDSRCQDCGSDAWDCLGCNACGVPDCRFCGFDRFADIPC